MRFLTDSVKLSSKEKEELKINRVKRDEGTNCLSAWTLEISPVGGGGL